jgi:hypothetical protein
MKTPQTKNAAWPEPASGNERGHGLLPPGGPVRPAHFCQDKKEPRPVDAGRGRSSGPLNRRVGVCTMCTTLAADRVVLRSDWAGFRMFSGVLSVCRGLNAVRVPPRAQCFRQAGGLLGASSLCTLYTSFSRWLGGVRRAVCSFSWPFLWPGPSLVGSVLRVARVHGYIQPGRHDCVG